MGSGKSLKIGTVVTMVADYAHALEAPFGGFRIPLLGSLFSLSLVNLTSPLKP